MSLSPFEPYLDVLGQSLRLLPPAEQAEWREEARQHLQEIALAAEHRGLTPDEALAEAIRQFGDATQIGHQMAQATECDPLQGRMAIALFCRPLVLAMLLLIGQAYAYVLTDSPLLFSALQWGGALAFVMVPTLAGWQAGKCFRSGQAILPVALGLALIGILSLPIAAVLLVPLRGNSVGGAAVDFRCGLCWLPLVGLSLMLSCRRNVRRTAPTITQA